MRMKTSTRHQLMALALIIFILALAIWLGKAGHYGAAGLAVGADSWLISVVTWPYVKRFWPH